jgi:hypothetical protein
MKTMHQAFFISFAFRRVFRRTFSCALWTVFSSALLLGTPARADETSGTGATDRFTDNGPEPEAGSLKSNTCQLSVTRLVKGKKETREITSGKEKILKNDVVKANGPPGCKTSIKLSDGTSLELNEKAELKIDDYVNSGSGNLGRVALSFIAGKTAMITGDQAKDSYRVDVPVAVIGIRGTVFTVDIRKSEERYHVTEGSIFVTSRKTARLYTVSKGQSFRLSTEDGKPIKNAKK